MMRKFIIIGGISLGLLTALLVILLYCPGLIQLFTIQQNYIYLVLGAYIGYLMILNPPTVMKIRQGFRDLKYNSRNKWAKLKQIFSYTQIRIGFVLILLILFCVVFADLLAPYSPTYRRSPSWDSVSRTFTVYDNLKPSVEHWFGTTPGGEDVFSQVLYGLRTTIQLAGMASVFGLVLGTVLGLVAGYYENWISKLIDYLVDMVLVLPILFLILLLRTTIKINFFSIVLIISVYGMAKTARLIKGEVLALKKREFVTAAVALGGQEMEIMYKHLLLVLYPILLTQFLTLMGGNIAIESSLSFLRFHNRLSLGTLIHNSFFMSLVKGNWWYFAFPALFLAIAIIGFSFFGDGLRQVIYKPMLEKGGTDV